MKKKKWCFGLVGYIILYILKDLKFWVGGMERMVLGRIKEKSMVWKDRNLIKIVGI